MSDSQQAKARNRCAFIAVGTELTSGELTDSNSAWVSSQVHELRFEMVFHQTVADDSEMIERALDQAAQVADFIFVSGGLGPTKDDFTREIIARWANAPLCRDELAVERLREKFLSRGRQLHRFQEQQCDFPRGAQVVLNEAGTADAFYLKVGKKVAERVGEKHLWTLPGPPREIASVWPAISNQLRGLAPEFQSKILKSWLCLGEGESVIAHLTEQVVENKPFETGYRAHAPYVEVKVWGSPEAWEKHGQLAELEQALSPYLVSRSRETFSKAFFSWIADKLPKETITIIDGATSGLWGREIEPLVFKKMSKFDSLKVVLQTRHELASDAEVWQQVLAAGSSWVFGLCYLSGGHGVRFYVKTQAHLYSEDFVWQKEHNIGQRFNALLAAEKACAFWLKVLTSS